MLPINVKNVRLLQHPFIDPKNKIKHPQIFIEGFKLTN